MDVLHKKVEVNFPFDTDILKSLNEWRYVDWS